MPKLSELLQTAHDPNPTPDDAIPTLKEVGGEATNKMAQLKDLPVSTAQAAADALKVNKAGDTMTGVLTTSSRYISTEGSIPYRHHRVKEIGFGAGSDGEYTVWDFTAGKANLRAFPAGISLGASTNPNIIHGTGFPNGVVSAPVGSTYIDTAATNGAIEWKKATGTGNTGWVVSVGDTGWRDVTALLTNGWTATSVLVKRTMHGIDIVVENLSAASSTGNIVLSLPVGFRSGVLLSRMFLTTATGPASVYRITLNNGGSLQMQNYSTSIPGLYGLILGSPETTWPPTLPGIPA